MSDPEAVRGPFFYRGLGDIVRCSLDGNEIRKKNRRKELIQPWQNKNWKGVILAGEAGTRLFTITKR